MKNTKQFDVIIIGGSYSGLSAGMALGRAMKNVLIVDNGDPCNKQTVHSHNFITQDGKSPKEILRVAMQQLERYTTVGFFKGLAVNAKNIENGYQVECDTGELFYSKKLILATGIKDLIPPIKGLAETWGISTLHCPYCHGYEVRNEMTGILANGDKAFELSNLISNWTKDLTLFTNGNSALTSEQLIKLSKHHIKIVETEIERLDHVNGYIRNIHFKDGTALKIKVLYAYVRFEQHCCLASQLRCDLTEEGYIKVDGTQKTSIYGVYACGDNTSRIRTVANAVATGTTAGMMINKEIVLQEF